MSDHNILVDLDPIEIESQLNWSSNLNFVLSHKKLKKVRWSIWWHEILTFQTTG